MRSQQEMMRMILNVAERDERVRLVTLEGSRTNPHIVPDRFQDYDISYFVTDMASYMKRDGWLSVFGKRIFMQKPESMDLFPPELGNWYSYLMLFEDGNRIDLTLIPLEETEDYFAGSDGLVEVLLDKDGRLTEEVVASDRQYWITIPNAKLFDDCCNEFWWVSTYVGKGLARQEILFAVDHLQAHVRPNLLRMISWYIGFEQGFEISLGKNYKFIDRFISVEDWQSLLSTYRQDGYQEVWQSLFTCWRLFRKYSKAVADILDCPYPEYDDVITKYTNDMYRS